MKRIIGAGLDVGLANTGYAVIERTSKYRILDSGVIRTSVKDTEGERLLQIYDVVSGFLEGVDVLGIESVFFTDKVRKSAMGTAACIGIAELAAAQAGILSVKITPQQAKGAVCPSGAADKGVVRLFVNRLCKANITNFHEADAVGIAIAAILEKMRQKND